MRGNLDPDKCQESVPTPGIRMHYHQCRKPVKVERDGKKYCSIHDPVYVKEKRDAKHRKWEHDWKRRGLKNKISVALENLANRVVAQGKIDSESERMISEVKGLREELSKLRADK